MRSRTERVAASLLFIRMRPPSRRRSPTRASTSSFCPLPSTPARPSISPRLTLNETFLTRATPPRPRTCTPSNSSTVSASLVGPFLTPKETARPTIIAASVSSEASATSKVPTNWPRLITVQRCAMALISRNLCVIRKIDLPSAARLDMILVSSCTSCGVSTAVGSSKIRISALR